MPITTDGPIKAGHLQRYHENLLDSLIDNRTSFDRCLSVHLQRLLRDTPLHKWGNVSATLVDDPSIIFGDKRALKLHYSFFNPSYTSETWGVYSLEELGWLYKTGYNRSMSFKIHSIVQEPMSSCYRYVMWYFMPEKTRDLSKALGVLCFGSDYYMDNTEDIPRQVRKADDVSVMFNIPTGTTHIYMYTIVSSVAPSSTEAVNITPGIPGTVNDTPRASCDITFTAIISGLIPQLGAQVGGTGMSVYALNQDRVVMVPAKDTVMSMMTMQELAEALKPYLT